MKRDNVNYLIVGTFVLIMIGTFFALMFFVTGETGPADHYTVKYSNVKGLKFGTGIFYEGYRVGQVEKITPAATPTGMQYILSLSIAKDWEIPDDSVARVVSSGLISAVQIEIEEGSSKISVPLGGEIRGKEQVNLFAVLGEAAGQLQALSQDGLMPVLQNLNRRIDELSSEMVGFRREDLTPLVNTLNKRLNEDLIGDAQSLVAKLDHGAEQLGKILGSDNRQHIKKFLVHIDDVAVNLSGLISRIEFTRVQMGETLAALKHLANDNGEQVEGAIRNANLSMQQMRKALATVNEHLSTIIYNVEGSTRQLHEFSQAVRDNPARLIRGTQ